MSSKNQQLVLVILLIWALIASAAASYLYLENEYLNREISAIGTKYVKVNIGINYGNGTIAWYNQTLLPKGATALTALLTVARVEYKIGTWGAYVTSVNGVAEKILSNNEGYSWMWYRYASDKGKLVQGEVAADKYKLTEGETIVWSYEHWKF
ncbi:MAG: DUF4430 domain-containing protein [Infirmifilum sp.]